MGLIASGGVTSGMLGTNAIRPENVASGSLAQLVSPSYSGGTSQPITAEIISGVRAVLIDTSGQVRIAMAAVSGRMPAIGVVKDNFLSGVVPTVLSVGSVQFGSGLADYSGALGARLFVGRSGQITTISGAWSSGGFASGDIGQVIAYTVNSGGANFNLGSYDYLSGGPMAWNRLGFDR